jgi:hypothetical protein
MHLNRWELEMILLFKCLFSWMKMSLFDLHPMPELHPQLECLPQMLDLLLQMTDLLPQRSKRRIQCQALADPPDRCLSQLIGEGH